jgi:Beta-propeller domains of methanol dehydrogenase type
LLLALQERKIRIETGYGLESVITDALSRRLIEQKIAPALRSGGVAEGLRAGSTGLMNLVRGDYQDLEARPEGEKGEPIGGSALFLDPIGLGFALGPVQKGRGRGSRRWP